MSLYKVLKPTNGFEVGAVAELTDEQADSYNAGEPTPRVELIKNEEAPVETGAGELPAEPVEEPTNEPESTEPVTDPVAGTESEQVEAEGEQAENQNA